jgi:catalase
VRNLYKKVMTDTDRDHLIENISGDLDGCKRPIIVRMIKQFYKVDPDYGTRIANNLGVAAEEYQTKE